MKITSTKKIIVEDFATESRSLVQRLAIILNTFLDQVTQALTANLTLADNLKAKVYTQQLASGTSTFRISWDINEKPTSVHIGSLTRSDGVVPAVYSLHWVYSDKIISCTITGLASAIHNVTLIAQV